MAIDMDPEEIAQEIAHHRKMVRALKRHLQVLEETKALKGIATEPHILLGIEDYKKDIHEHQDEIAKLQTLAAVDKEPLAEVEYRMTVASAWDTPGRRPSVAGRVTLEYQRLRLGIAPERAQEIEQEVRSQIVRELFRQVKRRFYRSDVFDLAIPWNLKPGLVDPDPGMGLLGPHVPGPEGPELLIVATIDYPLLHDGDEESLSRIVQCIMLDLPTTVVMFVDNFSREPIHVGRVRCDSADSRQMVRSFYSPSRSCQSPAFWLDVLYETFQRNLTFAKGASGVDTDEPIAQFVDQLRHAVVGEGES